MCSLSTCRVQKDAVQRGDQGPSSRQREGRRSGQRAQRLRRCARASLYRDACVTLWCANDVRAGEVLEQEDTFFRVAQGRLKVTEWRAFSRASSCAILCMCACSCVCSPVERPCSSSTRGQTARDPKSVTTPSPPHRSVSLLWGPT